MIALWIYLAGFVWFWRYHVGFIMEEDRGSNSEYGDRTRNLDGGDIFWGLSFGTLITLGWPMTVSGRVVYVLWSKYVAPGDTSFERLFPGPKPIETAQEKRDRKAREAREQIKARRHEINEHERKNGIELTRWTQ